MFRKLDTLLDAVTMYKVVLGGLVSLALIALSLSALGILNYAPPLVLVGTLAILVTVCVAGNALLAKLYKVSTAPESTLITALILFFVLAAPSTQVGWAGVALAALIAIASKYVITWHSSNIFNPAAFGVIAVSLLGVGEGAWWIANEALLAPMLFIGFLILKKLRRFSLFFAFAVPALALIVARTYAQDPSLIDATITALTLYPILFLGTIMLTEPATLPDNRPKQLLFGGIVGLLFGVQADLGFIATSPHLALLAGNVFTLLASPRASTRLTLVKRTRLTPTSYEYAFRPHRPVHFTAGQYMEFTLPNVALDARGNRRTFTIASSPVDDLIRIVVKFYRPSSSFKRSLQKLQIGDEIIGNRHAGDFTLPESTSEPLVFVAGGIGITPFIAITETMVKTGQKRPVSLYYFVADDTEVIYRPLLEQAKMHGIHVVIRSGKTARLTETDITRHRDARFYLSGPPGLVAAYKTLLRDHGVKKVETDYFSGY